MEAIVLAGGFGTRLRQVVADVPKPMAPMDAQGTPFLRIIMEQLRQQSCTHVVLSIGYKGEIIRNYFGSSYQGMRITYSVEDTPLLTGGAVKQALMYCQEKQVFVLNGDTYFAVDFKAMLAYHINNNAALTLAAKELTDFDRYGTLALVANQRIEAFREKKPQARGLINGGVYCINRNLLSTLPEQAFSLEKDFMEQQTHNIPMYAFVSDGYFVDIGVPEDYYRARRDLLAYQVGAIANL